MTALLALICTLALIPFLSGCSSQENAKAKPDVLTSNDTFTEGIENPELPERPAAMDNYDEEGAKATAEYFLRLSLYGVATDNWDEYNALCQPTCGFCNSYRDKNHEDYINISSTTMPEMKVQSACAWQLDDAPEQWLVDMLVKRYPSKTTDKDGATKRHEEGTAALAFLIDSADNWHIIEVESFDVEKYKELYGELSQ